MDGYLLIIKTIDGQTHEVRAEGDNAEVASLWVRNMEYGPWFEFLEGRTLKYINRNNIVSIDVVEFKAEEPTEEAESLKYTPENVKNLFAGPKK